MIFGARYIRHQFGLAFAVNRPIEIPATGLRMLTPASISAKQPAQTLAMDEDPLEPMISETTRTE
jgi:hypothetical protein